MTTHLYDDTPTMTLSPCFEKDNYVVIYLQGKLTHESMRYFRNQLYKILRDFQGRIVHLCCRELQEIDRLGVGCLLYFDHYLADQKKKLLLSEMPAHVESCLTKTLLRHCFIQPIYTNFVTKIIDILQLGGNFYENYPQNT